jgi:hypothetical protein
MSYDPKNPPISARDVQKMLGFAGRAKLREGVRAQMRAAKLLSSTRPRASSNASDSGYHVDTDDSDVELSTSNSHAESNKSELLVIPTPEEVKEDSPIEEIVIGDVDLVIVSSPEKEEEISSPTVEEEESPVVSAPVPSQGVIENTNLAVIRSEYETNWIESTTATVPLEKPVYLAHVTQNTSTTHAIL